MRSLADEHCAPLALAYREPPDDDEEFDDEDEEEEEEDGGYEEPPDEDAAVISPERCWPASRSAPTSPSRP